MQPITWQMLLKCREISRLADDAVSIAQHENPARRWYRDWLPQSQVFTEAVYAAADRFACPPDDVRPVALAGLRQIYERARRGETESEPALPKRRGWKAKVNQAPQGYMSGDECNSGGNNRRKKY